ncbi:histone-lysine N-methyltransferase PR-Set7 [Cataglyphis hispanica]|uniref:histone-lysine N-methyltransferase PR-Set7 n=1 Tax=Cataglyphis hispanica TaxID=1086592 RepID=UPI00217F2A06|nr:histone-lysine N-methyltransferase PR-Set7 [Cataglyphis hispanica]
MYRTTRASSHRTRNCTDNVAKGKWKYDREKNITVPLPVQSNDANSLVKKESKLFDTSKKVADSVDIIKPQSILETHKSSPNTIHSYQNSNVEVTKGKSPVSLAYYFFGNVQALSTCEAKNKVISDVEQFKTDETPVAVPIHGPSTPHRINMPSEDINEKATITTNEKQSVITLRSPLQVVKKSAPRGRKKAASNQSINHRSLKLQCAETNHSITDYFPIRRSVRKSKKTVLEEKQRDLENKVLCQVEDGLEIRYFPGKGRGVVTTRDFAKGEFVIEYIGELINQSEAKEREKVYAQDQNTGCYMYYFQHRNQQYCVDATAETNKLGRLVNHSRNGNLVARIVEVKSTPHLVLTAKEDIPIGVEVSYDYGDRSRESIRHHPWLAL